MAMANIQAYRLKKYTNYIFYNTTGKSLRYVWTENKIVNEHSSKKLTLAVRMWWVT